MPQSLIAAAAKLANGFDDTDTTSKLANEIFECLDCSDNMAAFTRQIIKVSVGMIKPGRQPCDFEAVAFGSLARGEATPYSDLEFFFLVEHKTPKIMMYNCTSRTWRSLFIFK